MLRTRSPQSSFYGSYLYERIVPQDHLLRKINAVVDFCFVNDLVKDRYRPHFGRPAEDPEFMYGCDCCNASVATPTSMSSRTPA